MKNTTLAEQFRASVAVGVARGWIQKPARTLTVEEAVREVRAEFKRNERATLTATRQASNIIPLVGGSE